MQVAYRVDIGTLRPPERLPDGRLRADGLLTRSGVFLYRNPDGSTRREYRPPEEVFDKPSIESFALATVTDDHPEALVTADNARQHAVGVVGERIRQDGDHVAAPLMIFDAAAIRKLEGGKQELSCGYVADIIDEPGVTPKGEKYDSIQRNIRGNHVAIVDAGRAGPSARVRMDDGAAVMITDSSGESTMSDDQSKNLIKALEEKAAEKARADQAEKLADEQKARADKLETELAEAENKAAEATKRADELEQSRKDAAETFDTAVRARVDLESSARTVLDAADLAGKTDREIKIAVVEKVDGTKIDADRSDDYVTARYDSAIERAGKSDKVLAGARDAVEKGREDVSDEDPETAAKRKMLERNRNAWKGKQASA